MNPHLISTYRLARSQRQKRLSELKNGLSKPVLSCAFGIALLCVFLVTPGHAQEAQEAPEPAPSTNQPAGKALQEALGSAFDSIGSFFKKATSPQQANTSEPSEASNSVTAAVNSGTGLQIVDITQVSTVSNTVVDPLCETPIAPFGLTDNAGSLLLLAGKMKLTNITSNLQQGGQAPLPIKEIIKVAARQLNWLPQPLEIKYGELLLKDANILKKDKNKESKNLYKRAEDALEAVVRGLPAELPYKFQILVKDKSGDGASALPGGTILIERDFFAKDEDRARFVIGHEISHVLQRHQTRAIQARLIDGVTTFEQLGKVMNSTQQSSLADVLGHASFLKKMVIGFSEQQEHQADSCALRWLSQQYSGSKDREKRLQKIIDIVAHPSSGSASRTPEKGQTVLSAIEFLGDGIYESHPSSTQRRDHLLMTLQALLNKP